MMSGGEYHATTADRFGNTAFIPANEYVRGKWCVTMDIRLYHRWVYYEKLYHAYPVNVANYKSENQGHIGIVNAATRPNSNTNIVHR